MDIVHVAEAEEFGKGMNKNKVYLVTYKFTKAEFQAIQDEAAAKGELDVEEEITN